MGPFRIIRAKATKEHCFFSAEKQQQCRRLRPLERTSELIKWTIATAKTDERLASLDAKGRSVHCAHITCNSSLHVIPRLFLLLGVRVFMFVYIILMVCVEFAFIFASFSIAIGLVAIFIPLNALDVRFTIVNEQFPCFRKETFLQLLCAVHHHTFFTWLRNLTLSLISLSLAMPPLLLDWI